MAKKKQRAKRKTVRELLEIDRAKVAEREAKLAMEEAKDDPRLETLINLLDEKKKTSIEYTKGFGNGPQSFASRIEAHQLWIDEIQAEQSFAAVANDLLKDQTAYLKEQIGLVATDIVKGLDGADLDEVIATVMENIPTSEHGEVREAELVMLQAKTLRQAIAAEKKKPKRAKKEG